MPVLSALGVQVCPLPTALLSTHTGGYTGFTFLDLTEEMDAIRAHWRTIGTKFDAVYSGFLGAPAQIRAVLDFVEECKANDPSCVYLADPVMGDEGKRYATYTDELCSLTGTLIEIADIITPNLTEACILLGIEYKTAFSQADYASMLAALKERCRGTVIITGVEKEDKIGAIYADKDGNHGSYFARRDPVGYPGTGDIFASIILGGALHGIPTDVSVKTACDFVAKASELTTAFGTPKREGLAFEGILSALHF